MNRVTFARNRAQLSLLPPLRPSWSGNPGPGVTRIVTFAQNRSYYWSLVDFRAIRVSSSPVGLPRLAIQPAVLSPTGTLEEDTLPRRPPSRKSCSWLPGPGLSERRFPARGETDSDHGILDDASG